jgi:hypothetical protein
VLVYIIVSEAVIFNVWLKQYYTFKCVVEMMMENILFFCIVIWLIFIWYAVLFWSMKPILILIPCCLFCLWLTLKSLAYSVEVHWWLYIHSLCLSIHWLTSILSADTVCRDDVMKLFILSWWNNANYLCVLFVCMADTFMSLDYIDYSVHFHACQWLTWYSDVVEIALLTDWPLKCNKCLMAS